MTDLQSLIRLQTWLSPAFPTGAFSYSHGLEATIAKGLVASKEELASWIAEVLTSGSGWNDAVLLAESWRMNADNGALVELAELTEAMSFSGPRHLETTAQGSAFVLASKAWCEIDLPDNCPLSVAVGAVAGRLDIELETTLAAYLHAYVSNQVQAALRLMKLGQQGGVEVLAQLEENIVDVSKRAATSSLDDLGSNTIMADITAMQHETLPSRIFRS
ncbi:MAG: urease accessory protein UreF [Rhizobiaceae bacterium]|nr:urease accessory protein UreF [Rhizobiaceae bacterium]